MHEAHHIERHGRPGLRARLVAERDLSLVQGDQSPVREGDPSDVWREIFQGRASVSDRLAVDDPLFAPGLRRNLRKQVRIGGVQGVAEFRPEDLPQGRGGHEKLGMRGHPGPGLRIEAPGRDQIVDMDMIAHRPIPGMEDAHHPNRAAEPLRIQGERLERVRGRLEQQVIDEFLVRAGQRIERMGQGDGDEDIGDREEFFQLGVAPGIGPVAAACRTMAIAAGVIAVDVVLAVLAPEHLAPHQGRAAVGDIPQRVVVAGWHVVAVLGLIRGAIFLEDVGQFQHLGPPMNGLEILHQIINHGARARLRLGGEVGVAGCGLGRRMPQIRLNDAQTHAGFQQVGGVGMAQAVDRDAFGDARLLLGEATGFLQRTDRNRRRGWLTLRPAGPAGRKQPDRMAVREPILAQQLQGTLGEGHIAVFIAFAAADMHEHASTVNVRHPELGAFGQP